MITDNEVIRFSNEVVRPKCEEMRNLYYELKAMVTYWQDTISGKVPNDSGEILEDNRPDATELTGEDIYNFVAEGGKFINAMEQPGVLSAIQKPCVRHLQVS
jgi:hypothetical protein